MTLKTYLFEGGTDGATQTTGNTGANQVNGPTYATFAASAAASGALGGKWAPPAGSTSSTRFLANASNNTMAFSGVVTTPAAQPSTAANNVLLATLRGSATALRFVYTNAGQFQVQDAANLAAAQMNVGAISPNTKYRVEAQLVVGASTTTGSVAVQVYNNSTNALVGQVSSTTYNIGTTALTGGDFGFFASLPSDSGQVIQWDNIQFNDGATTAIGAYSAPAAPTAAFTFSPNGLTVSFDGSGTTVAGGATVATYAWNFGNGNTASGASATTSTTYATTGTYTVTLTVTDSNGQTGTVSHTVSVLAPAATVGAVAVVSAAGFTVFGSAPDILTAITDTDVTTGAISAAAPSSTPFTVQLGPHVVPATGTDMTETVEIDMTGASTGTVSAKLIEGSTTRATASAQALVNVATGSSMSHTATITFPAASIANVTNWNSLKLELDVTAA